MLVDRTKGDECAFKLAIVGVPDRKFKFKAPNLKEANSWLAAIGKHIS